MFVVVAKLLLCMVDPNFADGGGEGASISQSKGSAEENARPEFALYENIREEIKTLTSMEKVKPLRGVLPPWGSALHSGFAPLPPALVAVYTYIYIYMAPESGLSLGRNSPTNQDPELFVGKQIGPFWDFF